MKKNTNNKKSGNPSNNQRKPDSNDRKNMTGGGVPRSVMRSFDRMKMYNEQKAAESPLWEAHSENIARAEQAEEDLKNKPKPKQRFRRQSSKSDGPNKAEFPSAPVNLPLYEGQACGGQAVSSINSHNYDFSIMPCFIREIHNMMTAKETTFTRTLPYCVLQHYLNTILNAVLIKRVMIQNADKRFTKEVDPFDTIHADNLYVPAPFLSYLNGYGTNTLLNGDKVYPNLPHAGTPRMTRRVANTPVESGTFGVLNADSHNAYECYMAPYVTKALILRTLGVFNNGPRGAWMPLPEVLVPANSIATPNLLGYELPENIRGETANIIQRFHFHNSDSMAGRLCYSDELMNHVSGVLHERSDKFKMVRGIPVDSSVNPAAFIYTNVETDVDSVRLLSNTHGTTCCSEAFGASASNMANYFAYHRQRSLSAPGYCLLQRDGTPFANWDATINSNHNMEGNFAPLYGLDYPHIRSLRFRSGSLSGTCEASIRTWLDKEFNIRT